MASEPMTEVEALGIVLDMLARAQSDDWGLPVPNDLAAREVLAQEVLFQMWIARGGKADG